MPKKAKVTRRLNHKLLDKFVGHVLDRYRNGEKDRLWGISMIGHLAAALDLPADEGDDPNSFMKAILERGEDD